MLWWWVEGGVMAAEDKISNGDIVKKVERKKLHLDPLLTKLRLKFTDSEIQPR